MLYSSSFVNYHLLLLVENILNFVATMYNEQTSFPPNVFIPSIKPLLLSAFLSHKFLSSLFCACYFLLYIVAKTIIHGV